jgi:hypothetical protein
MGVSPMDNFVLYNGGYRILKGYIPFNDYWLVTGPLLDYLNAFFFNIFGLNWKSYIIHSSIFNTIIALSTYFILLNFNLSKLWSLFYSILFSMLMYPVVGTPFVDHHSTIFLILSFYLFIFSVNKDNSISLFFIPFLFTISFLCKQTPAAYGVIGVFFLIVLYAFLNKDIAKKILVTSIFGTIFAISFLLIFFYFTEIKIELFFEQYILFAKTIGGGRLGDFNFNILNFFLDYKFINIYILALSFIIFKIPHKTTSNKKLLVSLISVITLALVMLLHQSITLNQNFVFFMIPLLAAITHVNYRYLFKNKNYLIIIILICSFAVIKYHFRFNEHRKFNELEKVDLSIAEDAASIHSSLKGLKWITSNNPTNPKLEINDIKEAINVLKNEKKKMSLITQYQIIAPILSIYDHSPNQWHHPGISFPLKGHKYFNAYKNYFTKSLKKNKVEVIYSIGYGEGNLINYILDASCFEKKQEGKLIYSFNLKKNCKDFNSN